MTTYPSGDAAVRVDQFEPKATGRYPALVVLHGSSGSASFWIERFAPTMLEAGVAAYAPHYFDKTGTQHATSEMIRNGKHSAAWLAAVRDAIGYVASRPAVDPRRIAVVGASLGGFLAIAVGTEDDRVRALVELSGGVPSGWETRVHPKMPPTLILHGADDHVVPASEAYKLQSLLEEQRVPHEMEIFPHESHWFSSGAQMQLVVRSAKFLMRYL